ncbi:hypothetical protein LX32DRAFT_118625 [Colletotrichum zoysiae]|uniref:Uncharacterized protein n=1 Tax=Colletotrichum zoysiae TaxID=1216348 RepID=A0AAD9HSS0_9PEZI|nr:hypothetical protein LX32DRAFT_118625 [Colletotrichum zoysiae]
MGTVLQPEGDPKSNSHAASRRRKTAQGTTLASPRIHVSPRFPYTSPPPPPPLTFAGALCVWRGSIGPKTQASKCRHCQRLSFDPGLSFFASFVNGLVPRKTRLTQTGFPIQNHLSHCVALWVLRFPGEFVGPSKVFPPPAPFTSSPASVISSVDGMGVSCFPLTSSNASDNTLSSQATDNLCG